MNLKLRHADLKDVGILKRWDKKDHVIASSGNDDFYDWEEEVTRNVPWQQILIAEIDDRPIGVIVIIDPKEEETHYWGGIENNLKALDIWIGEASDLSKGYGTEMMKQALNECFRNENVKAVIVDPLIDNTLAHKFYEKLGFKRIEKRKFGNDECFVYKIDRNIFVNRLAKVTS